MDDPAIPTARTWRIAVAVALLVPALLVLPALRPGVVLSAADGLLDAYLLAEARPAGYARSNQLLTDSYRQFIPWRTLTSTELRAGRVPFWNPYAYAGSPLLGNGQSGVFDPLALPYLVTPDRPETMTVLVALLRLAVAALGALLLARRLGVGPVGSTLAAVVYGCGGFTVTWLLSPHTSSSAWIPWVFLAAERLKARPDGSRAAQLAGLLALVLFGGHVEVAFFTALAVSASAMLRRQPGEVVRSEVRSMLGWILVAGVICVAITAIQTLPFLEAVGQGRILNVDARGPRAAPWSGFHPERIISQFFPYLFGRPVRGEVGFWTPSMNFHDLVGAYGSVLALVLAGIAWARARRGSGAWTLGIVGLVAWAYHVGIPPLPWLGSVLPVARLAPAERIVPIALCALAVLAGIGLDGLLRRVDRGAGERSAARVMGVVGAGATAIGVLALVVPEPLAAALRWALQGRAGALVFGEQMAQVVVGLPGVVAPYGARYLVPWGCIVLASAALLPRLRRGRDALGWLAVGIVAVDLMAMGAGYNPTLPTELVFPDTRGLARTREAANAGRALMIQEGLPPNAATRYRIRDVQGYDVLDRDRLGRLLAIADPVRRFSSLGYRDSWVHDVLGVRVVTSWAPLDDGKLVPAGSAGAGFRYLNPAALEPVFAARSVRGVETARDAEAVLRAPGFDPRESVVVEGVRSASGARLNASARVDRPYPAALTVELDVAAPGLVVVSEGYDPGWTADVDGEPTPIWPADLALIAVEVPAGRHTLNLRFTPRSWSAARASSTVGIVVTLALLANGWRRRVGQQPS